MNRKSIQPSSGGGDSLKWTAVGLLLAGAVTGHYYYFAQPLSIKLIGWFLLTAVVLVISVNTDKGKQALSFTKESKIELNKVFWPTRPEVVQTTLIVVVMVLIMGLLLWALDSFLLWGVGVLTGQRG